MHGFSVDWSTRAPRLQAPPPKTHHSFWSTQPIHRPDGRKLQQFNQSEGSIFSSEGPNREWSGHVPLRRQSLPRLLLPRCSQHAQEICGSEERLQLAWDHDPLITLKLICNLRGVRGTGKSDKEGFYTAALWLHGSHPKTLACNLESLSKFGYFKDFPEILDRILKGSKIRDTQKSEWMQRKSCRGRGRRVDGFISKTGQGSRKRKTAATREVRVATAEMKNQADKAIASINRKLEKISMGKEAFTRYSHDAEYRFLHERVSDLFSNLLRRDLEFLTSGETNKISLAAKWCPSIDSSFDKATLLCESIARKLFPRETFPEYEGVEEAHYG
ncbi:hypothetical protein YC2023_116847 [Brassica napus]